MRKDLPILQQKPQIKEIPSNVYQQKNDVLSNIATSTMEFLDDSLSAKADDIISLSWYEKLFFKNNRIFYIGLLFLIVALIIFISNSESN